MSKAPKIDPQDQARILSEALPHMQRYDEEIVVVKYGGHAMGDDDRGARLRPRHRAARADRHQSGRGARRRAADRRQCSRRLGIKSQFAGGLRVTDEATLEIVEMVLAGSINKQIVGYINAAGGKAIGLCGKDGNMVIARKVTRTVVDPDSQYREDRRSRLRRRAGKGRHHRARHRARPRPHPGAGAGRGRRRRRHLQRQCRHLRRRHCRRAQGQAVSAADRRAGRARQGQAADQGTVGRPTRAS